MGEGQRPYKGEVLNLFLNKIKLLYGRYNQNQNQNQTC